MQKAHALVRRFAAAETGATSIEYGLIAALMAVACIAAFSNLGSSSGGAWGNMATKAAGNMK